jgi:hypothetical protein
MSVKLGLSPEGKNIDWEFWEEGAEREEFGSKREEVTRGWRELHNEELNLYASPIPQCSKMNGTVTTYVRFEVITVVKIEVKASVLW